MFVGSHHCELLFSFKNKFNIYSDECILNSKKVKSRYNWLHLNNSNPVRIVYQILIQWIYRNINSDIKSFTNIPLAEKIKLNAYQTKYMSTNSNGQWQVCLLRYVGSSEIISFNPQISFSSHATAYIPPCMLCMFWPYNRW